MYQPTGYGEKDIVIDVPNPSNGNNSGDIVIEVPLNLPKGDVVIETTRR